MYDPATRIFYVGNGGHAAHAESAYVSMISVDKRAVVGRIEVPATTLKTVVLDAKNERLYVTMRDKNQVAVIDLKQRKVERSSRIRSCTSTRRWRMTRRTIDYLLAIASRAS